MGEIDCREVLALVCRLDKRATKLALDVSSLDSRAKTAECLASSYKMDLDAVRKRVSGLHDEIELEREFSSCVTQHMSAEAIAAIRDKAKEQIKEKEIPF